MAAKSGKDATVAVGMVRCRPGCSAVGAAFPGFWRKIDRLGVFTLGPGLTFALWVGVTLAILTPATAQQVPPTAIIIFDGSTSMWGRVGETSKFDAARTAINAVIPRHSKRIALGLMAYGHRRQGDCDDIETLVPPGIDQASGLGRALQSINPRGKTPIASALEAAASQLAGLKRPHIVLLTDGIENCRPDDLCRTARGIKEAVPGLSISVIGFGMRAGDVEKIRCIAEAGGGTLVSPRTRKALEAALDQAFARITHDRQPATAQAGSTEPLETEIVALAGPPRLLLHARHTPDGLKIRAPLDWRVVSLSPAGVKEVYRATAPAPEVLLEPGRYRVEARLGFVSRIQEVNLTGGGDRSLQLALNSGTLEVHANPDMRAGLLVVEPVDPVPPRPGRSTQGDAANPFPVFLRPPFAPAYHLPAGRYRVRRANPLAPFVPSARNRDRSIEIANIVAGATTSLPATTATGRLAVETTMSADDRRVSGASGRGPVTLVQVFDAAPRKNRAPATEIARSAARRPVFQLPPGVYLLRARAGHARTEQTIDIAANTARTVRLSLDAGTLELDARLTGAGQGAQGPTNSRNDETTVTYRITPLRSDAAGAPRNTPVEAVVTHRRRTTVVLPAGNYRVEASIGSANARTTTQVVLNAGATEHPDLNLAVTTPTLRLDNTAVTGPASWQIATRDGATVWTSVQTSPRPVLAPGTYTITAEYAGRKFARRATLIAGASQIIQLGPVP